MNWSVTWRLFAVCMLVGACGSIARGHDSNSPIAWQEDYRAAQAQRAKRKQPMLVFIMSDYCGHCHRMMKSTYSDPRIAKQIQGRFIPTIVNASEAPKLAAAFKVTVYPTTIVVDSNNRIIDRIEGYVDRDRLQKRLAKIKTTQPRVAAASPRN